MQLWNKTKQWFITSKPQRNQIPSEKVDYGDRLAPPNSFIGKGSGDKWVKPEDPLNPSNPFSSKKRERF